MSPAMLKQECWGEIAGLVLSERCHFQELRGSQVFAGTNAGQIPAVKRPRLEISDEFLGPQNPTKLWKVAIFIGKSSMWP